MVTGINLYQQSHHLTPCLRVHREEVDDVGPVVAALIAVADQARSDRVAVGLVVDQDSAERIASLGAKALEGGPEIRVVSHHAILRAARRQRR
jgi:hypothetical protein